MSADAVLARLRRFLLLLSGLLLAATVVELIWVHSKSVMGGW